MYFQFVGLVVMCIFCDYKLPEFVLSRWYLYQVLIWTRYCTHKYVTTLRHPGEEPRTNSTHSKNISLNIWSKYLCLKIEKYFSVVK